VLAACGEVLRRIHAAGFDHGDFGPQNTLFDPALYAGYGMSFPWWQRQAAMVRRCAELAEFTREWEAGGAGETLWRERLETTAARRE
jgi:hypothetical protein